jgi:hypothetical protein
MRTMLIFLGQSILNIIWYVVKVHKRSTQSILDFFSMNELRTIPSIHEKVMGEKFRAEIIADGSL